MSSHAFSDLLGEVDSKIGITMGAAASGMSNHIVPLAWVMLAISLLVYSLLVLEGRIHNPMRDWIVKGVWMMLIIYACSSYYGSWVSGPLTQLPNGLSAAISSSGNPNTVLDNLGGNLMDLVAGIASGAVDAFSGFNIGGGLLLFFAMIDIAIVGALLLVACTFNVLYAKIGLAMLLAVGPFFILCLFWSQTRGYFYSWLNTALYFVFLSVFSTLFVVFFIGIAQTFMDQMENLIKSLTAQGGASSYAIAVAQAIKAWASGGTPPANVGASSSNFLNIVKLVIEINFVFIPMFLLALEMRTMVSSMTNGSGGSAGGGIEKLMRMR